MKRKNRKGQVLCALTGAMLLFGAMLLPIEAGASERSDDYFYILDEDGNPVVVDTETTEDEGVVESDSLEEDVESYSLEEEELNTNARSTTIGVVRFNSGVVNYTEVDTGRAGYLNGAYAGDAAYLSTNSDGSVVCKISGVVIKVAKSYVKTIDDYSDGAKFSYYSVSSDGYLIHYYTYYSGSTLCTASTRVGYKQSYLSAGTKYYSYDGHYFYTSFKQMITDYRNGVYSNAVNATTPYYNYYQYLSMHTTAAFTAEQYNSHVAAQKSSSVMLKTGSAFVSTQSKYTINALLMFGVAINESGWGTSAIAMNKNNLFGLKAVDSSAYSSADTYKSLEACIDDFAYGWIHKGYLNGMDGRYRGPHLGDKHSGINVKYASDPYWGEKAAARGYYLDTAKVEYQRYTLGIAKSGALKMYKEANSSSKVLYTSEAANGSGSALYMYDYPVTILGEERASDGTLFYKVVSDMSLKSDKSATNYTAIYDSARDYVYVKASDVTTVVNGTATYQDTVLSKVSLTSSNGYVSGFTVGSDISSAVNSLQSAGSGINVVVRNTNGTQITSGTVGTGMTMEVTANGSTVTYTVVVRGDLNGDGKLTGVDYVKLRNYLDGLNSLQGAYLSASDTSGDGKVSSLDYVKLRNCFDGKSTIVQ